MILSAICKKHAQPVNFSKAKKIMPVRVQFVVFLKDLRVADIFLIRKIHYLTREFRVKLHVKTDIARIAKR